MSRLLPRACQAADCSSGAAAGTRGTPGQLLLYAALPSNMPANCSGGKASVVACRWVGDATAVQARGKTVVRLREDQQTGELRSVHIPDHLDILVRSATINHHAQERIVV